MRSLVEFLADLGHRRVARVAGLPELRHVAVRTATFERIAAELGMRVTVVDGDFSGEEGARLTRELLRAPRRPTAIVFDNDLMGVAGLAIAQELGVAVPAELSIVSWEDSPLCRLVHPPLTALARDIPAFGMAAAHALADIIDGGEPHAIQAETLTLSVRGTTAEARITARR
jgi:DNA-binding LacI/PurR family transcriptional regulator